MSQATGAVNKGMDWTVLSLYLSLVIIGLLMQYSSYFTETTQGFLDVSPVFNRQMMWTGLALVLFFSCLLIDWKFWNIFTYPLYGLTIISLIVVLIFGTEIKGATSWIKIAGFSFQPSELAKFTTCLAMASYLGSFKSDLKDMSSIAIALAIPILPAALILLQPDAGSALVFTSFLVVLYRRGLNSSLYLLAFMLASIFILALKFSPQVVLIITLAFIIAYLFWQLIEHRMALIVLFFLLAGSLFFIRIELLLIGLTILTLVLSGFYFFRYKDLKKMYRLLFVFGFASIVAFGSKLFFDKVLESHQQERINVWLRPELCDPRGSLYNILQSKMAIGSGGIQGKGFLQGSMTRLNYVPEQSTDFIFSVIGEEQGFIGSISVIFIFAFLIVRITTMAERARNGFMSNYAYAVAGILLVHFFLNIGMAIGIMPVIGIPLPFISKGGSAIVAFSIMIGVLLKMDMSRYSR